MSYTNIAETGLTTLNAATGWLRRGGGSESLVDFTQVGRVEPLVMIDQAAMHLDCIGDVQQSMLSIFAGYYLQAASLSNSMGSIRVLDRLEALNPNRDPAHAAMNQLGWSNEAIDENSWTVTVEAYKNGLPFLSDKKSKLAVETFASGAPIPSQMNAASKDDDKFKVQALSKGDIGRTMNELVNLSVGKAFEINITDGKNTVPVQINIRLIASMLSSQDMIHILATGSDDNSWKERWHGWKSGRLAFWKDLVFCTDLIDKHRSDLLKDRTGTLASITGSTLGNQVSALVTGNPTIASSTNMVVITKDTADALELQLEGKLSNYAIRHRMMKKTALMIIAVIDTDYQTLTLYHRGIPLPTTVRLKDLKASNKGNGPDIADILKSLMGGHAPSL